MSPKAAPATAIRLDRRHPAYREIYERFRRGADFAAEFPR